MSANNVDLNIQSGTYLFDSFSFDVARRALIKGEERFNLTRKQFEILLLLVMNAGQPVAKDQFLKQIWPDQDVEEANLVVNIHSLRRII
ncbi:MAG: Transcriptional regulator HilA, partial [Acidobacteriota bacterium]